jgi:hypothetical protein
VAVTTLVPDARSCIVGCYTTEDYFLAREGVFLLLDLLSVRKRKPKRPQKFPIQLILCPVSFLKTWKSFTISLLKVKKKSMF